MNVRIEKYGVRWQSEAATPLFARSRSIRKRRAPKAFGVPAALQNRAFTLIELILVLALLAIVTSLVAPAMSNFIRGRALDAEARRLVALTHAGQSRAVSEGMPIMIWVNEKENSYGIEQETPGKDGDAKAESFQVDDTLQIAVLKLASGAQTTIRTLPAIRFLADGTIDESSPQTLHLTHANGGELWLIELRNRTGYEIRNTEK